MAKRGPGRPPKPSTKNRKRRTIRFSDEEWERVQELADKAGTSKSRFIRSAIFGYEITPAIDQEMLKEVHRIGVNINQIAKQANTKKEITECDHLREAKRKMGRAALWLVHPDKFPKPSVDS